LLSSAAACSDSFTKSVRTGFIEETGITVIQVEYASVDVYRDGDKLNFRIKRGGSSVGPSEAMIALDAAWFAYVSDIDHYWIYDGDKDLIYYEWKSQTGTVFSLKSTPDVVLKNVPAEVRERVPHLFQ